jgi:hypothetical protein
MTGACPRPEPRPRRTAQRFYNRPTALRTLTIDTDGGPRTVTRTTTRPIRNLKANRPWSGPTSGPAGSGVATDA